MGMKIRKLADVLASFAAAYPGRGTQARLEWIGNWRACYPQFQDAIFQKASDMLLEKFDASVAPHDGDEEKVIFSSTHIVNADEQDVARLTFVGIEDPTPEELAVWKARHPEMAEEFVAMAVDRSREAYLRVPALPPTAAEVQRARKHIAELVSKIEAMPPCTSTQALHLTAYRPVGRQAVGEDLRKLKRSVVGKFNKDIAARRRAASGIDH